MQANVVRDDYHCSMTVGEAYTQLSVALHSVYEPREAANIAGMVTEYITGFTNTMRLIHKNDALSDREEEIFRQMRLELATGKPLQYVLREAWFYGIKLYLDESVLIPRPETEELVDWVIKDVLYAKSDTGYQILDIGTGSGCIPIAIKKHLQRVTMYAADISEQALQVAKTNAEEQNTQIHFLKKDILDEQQWASFPMVDCIISNPPYVRQSEVSSMHDNVLKYEPHLALFVPDKNPLLFYDVISSFGLQHLKNNGKLFFEINEALGAEVAELLSEKGYKNIELRKDLQDKDRMIKAEKTALSF